MTFTLELYLFRVLCSSCCLRFHLFKSENKQVREAGDPPERAARLSSKHPAQPLSHVQRPWGWGRRRDTIYHGPIAATALGRVGEEEEGKRLVSSILTSRNRIWSAQHSKGPAPLPISERETRSCLPGPCAQGGRPGHLFLAAADI